MDASSIFDRVQNTTLRNVAALDMEASAFLQAGDFTGVQCIGVIKGVSDMGDGKKQQANDKYYTTALCRAARAAKSYVRYKLDKVPKAVLDYSREPGVVITHGYFDDTIARVMDKLEYAEYKAEVQVEGLRIVLPGKLQQEDPEEEDVESFNVDSFSASDGALASLIRNYGLQEITLKGPPRQTNIHLKGSYLVDLPTTLAATLSQMQGKDKQVNLFRESMTNKVKRYKGFVQVITWEEFQKLLPILYTFLQIF
ncbi:hypothetical protein FOFC_07753 [Fusarium oxysporum]|nr:hypothetical protein FOFC_07753 [Fusarium oxysporum]